MEPQDFLTDDEKIEIIQIIEKIELESSTEIRVHIDKRHKGKLSRYVKKLFHRLGMNETQNRNAILFYVAIENREFYVFGDKGIDEKTSPDFWNTVKDVVIEHFKKDEFMIGFKKGIELCREQLRELYPYQEDDINELPDDISYGE